MALARARGLRGGRGILCGVVVGGAMKITSPPYPPNWKQISLRIRARASGRCECHGECGLHRTHPGPRRCVERHGEPAVWAKGRIVLTVAHLNHEPSDCRDENLRAMCQRCHLRYDVTHHMKNAKRSRLRALTVNQETLW